ncbi:MAG: T9SS type A sorting domain-containing protein [Bacteroidia bacterium]
MNKILLLIIFCIIGITRGNAQANVYHPFPTANGFWQYKHTNSIHPITGPAQVRYGINGDTIINALTYHKVYSLFDSTLNSPWSTYYGCFREQNKQVFAIFGNNAETMLYDFNMAIGDTITYTYSLATQMPLVFKRILTKVDSALMEDGKYRTRYIFDPGPGTATFVDTVAEGLGSEMSHGLFEPLYNTYCTCGDVYTLTCIKTDDTTRFLRNPECDHCFCTFLTPVQGVKDFSGKISPNPFSDKTTLSFSRNLNNATLTLFDATGRQTKVLKNITGQMISVYRNEMPAGVYIIELKEENTILAKEKVIVAD